MRISLILLASLLFLAFICRGVVGFLFNWTGIGMCFLLSALALFGALLVTSTKGRYLVRYFQFFALFVISFSVFVFGCGEDQVSEDTPIVSLDSVPVVEESTFLSDSAPMAPTLGNNVDNINIFKRGYEADKDLRISIGRKDDRILVAVMPLDQEWEDTGVKPEYPWFDGDGNHMVNFYTWGMSHRGATNARATADKTNAGIKRSVKQMLNPIDRANETWQEYVDRLAALPNPTNSFKIFYVRLDAVTEFCSVLNDGSVDLELFYVWEGQRVTSTNCD